MIWKINWKVKKGMIQITTGRAIYRRIIRRLLLSTFLIYKLTSFGCGKFHCSLKSIGFRRPIAHYQFDSPITEHGKICAALIGRGILLANYQPEIVSSSN